MVEGTHNNQEPAKCDRSAGHLKTGSGLQELFEVVYAIIMLGGKAISRVVR